MPKSNKPSAQANRGVNTVVTTGNDELEFPDWSDAGRLPLTASMDDMRRLSEALRKDRPGRLNPGPDPTRTPVAVEFVL